MTGNITMFPWLFFFFLACLFSYLHPSATWCCIPCFSLSGSCQSNIWKAGHQICIMSLWKKPLKSLTSYCIDIKVVFVDQGSRNRRQGTKIFQVQITKFEGKMKNKTKKTPNKQNLFNNTLFSSEGNYHPLESDLLLFILPKSRRIIVDAGGAENTIPD